MYIMSRTLKYLQHNPTSPAPGTATFSEPVGAKTYPWYHEVVKEPMDFGSVESNLEKENYDTPQVP